MSVFRDDQDWAEYVHRVDHEDAEGFDDMPSPLVIGFLIVAIPMVLLWLFVGGIINACRHVWRDWADASHV